MRISEVNVSGLYGIFDHHIPLNLEERITIIIGPNGLGKTAVLRMLDSVINGQYGKLRSVPFQNLSLNFVDPDSSLRVYERPRTEPMFEDLTPTKVPRELWLAYSSPFEAQDPIRISPRDHSERTHLPLSVIEEEIAGLERIGARQWRYLPTWETLHLDEVIDRFGDLIQSGENRRSQDPDWLKELRSAVHVRLVETQRLIGTPGPLTWSEQRLARSSRESLRTEMIPSVSKYSKELVMAIQSVLAESAELSQKLDSSFPRRVVRQNGSSALSPEQLRQEINQLEVKRNYLESTGLLDGTQEIGFGQTGQIDDEMVRVLSVYVDDTKQKLAVFDELAMRINLLTKMINDRVLFKTLRIDREEGFVFINTSGQNVPVTGLSSGEQHRLVLLYELLFRVPEGALILIDEPELSLHVAWQESFLRDIQEIADLRNFDVLIATHSPQIINDRWDLAVELKGPGVRR